jgi:hypothetical protein
MTIKIPIRRLIAVLLVSFPVAYIAGATDVSLLAKINSMSAAEYIEYQRELFTHSYFHHYFLMLIMGGFYVASVEFVAFMIGLLCRKPAAEQVAER